MASVGSGLGVGDLWVARVALRPGRLKVNYLTAVPKDRDLRDISSQFYRAQDSLNLDMTLIFILHNNLNEEKALQIVKF